MEEKRHRIGAKIILGITALFFYLPILYIIVFSFNDSRSLTKFSGFSLRWYEKMFSDSAMMQSVVYTIVIAILATIISTVAGHTGCHRSFPFPESPPQRGGTGQ